MPIDLLVLVLILVLQPLLVVLYAYALFRLCTRVLSRTSGRWVDARIDRAKDAADDLARGDD